MYRHCLDTSANSAPFRSTSTVSFGGCQLNRIAAPSAHKL